jgi:hypothetical protein
VVVVDPGAGAGTVVVVVVVVVVPVCANAADAGSAVRTEQTAIAAAVRPIPERTTRARDVARERPHCDRLKFISAPEDA